MYLNINLDIAYVYLKTKLNILKNTNICII